MVTIRPQSSPAAQQGTSLLEVLITIVILAIGLLGLAGLQTRLQSSEIEAYQRSQALILLNDMPAASPPTAPMRASTSRPRRWGWV